MSPVLSSVNVDPGTIPDRLMNLQTKLGNIASQLVSAPGQPADVAASIEEVTQSLGNFDSVQNMQPPPIQLEGLLNAVRAQLLRVHLLLESALAYHSGSLLASSTAPDTYTPEGKWLSTAAGANVNLEA